MDNQFFIYRIGRRSQACVKRKYIQWRQRQNPPLPTRCDIPQCCFFDNPNVWNGKDLSFILDHKNGVSGDNTIENLRLLCPNCNSQQSTYGGRNKGRVKQYDTYFSTYDNGKTHSVVFVDVGILKLTGNKVEISSDKG